jgi:hypothetical protein
MTADRQQALARIRELIESQSWPRVQMTLLVSLTGAIGFLTSFVLLHLGMTTMWVRYLLSMVAAYLAFLFLLWVWAKTRDKNLTDILDFPDFGRLGQGSGSKSCGREEKGGDFEGGGASGSNQPEITAAELPGSSEIAGATPDALALDELAIPLVVLMAIFLLLGSAFLVMNNAPALFAELILDGILSASLYRRLRGLDQKHWLETAIRNTAVPFTTVTLLLVGIGWIIQWLDPSANSIGEFLAHHHYAAGFSTCLHAVC